MSIIVFNTILYGSIFKLFLEHMYWLKIQNCWLCTLKWWVCVSCHSVAKGSSKFRPILDLNHVNLSHYYNFLLVYRFMGLLCFRINLHPSELPASPTGYVWGASNLQWCRYRRHFVTISFPMLWHIWERPRPCILCFMDQTAQQPSSGTIFAINLTTGFALPLPIQLAYEASHWAVVRSKCNLCY